MVVDLIWLGYIGRPIYLHFLSEFLRETPNWIAAWIFYILYILGVLIFAIEPAIKQGNVQHALTMGALYGFFTYMTFQLTNLAVLKGWPAGLVWIDIAWGTILSGVVSSCSVWLYLRYFS